MNNFRTKRRGLSMLAPLILILCLPLGASAELLLNELLADPVADWSGDGSSDYRNDEWVEIVNVGDQAMDVSDYWLSDSVTDPAVRYRFSGTLAPGETVLVTGATALDWQAETGNGSGALSLSNSGGEVALFRDGPDGTELVDSVAYLGYQVDDDRAMGRAGAQGGEWILYDGLNIYHGNQVPGSTGCLPSPGEANACEEVATEGSSVSGVKDRYPGN